MSIPNWADHEASCKLPILRAMRERQTIEYTVSFPEQARELAKEIAAFATAGSGGVVLIGVAKDRSLIGLAVENAEAASNHVDRARQLIAKCIDPIPNASVEIASEDGKAVICIQIEAKQDEPVCYVDQKPYIRDGSVSRPATPHEVKERVWSHPSSEMKRKQQEILLSMQENHARLRNEMNQNSVDAQIANQQRNDQASTAFLQNNAESWRRILGSHFGY